MKYLSIVAFALVFLVGAAYGQNVTTTNDYSTTLGTSAVPCVPADGSRKTLFIENPLGGSNNVGYCIGASCVPVIGDPGTSVLLAGSSDFWPTGSAPTAPLQCIASGAASPVTIRSGQ